MEPIHIKNFLPKQVSTILYQYCLMKFSRPEWKPQIANRIDKQTDCLAWARDDDLMQTILDLSTPVVEKNVNKKLYPTYSYLRVYEKGTDLRPHTDREACEYTVALCIGSSPNDEPYNLFMGSLDESQDYQYLDMGNIMHKFKIEHKIPVSVNDAVIFQGIDKLHWREKCNHDHYITVFLHYVDQEGKYADQKFDGNNGL